MIMGIFKSITFGMICLIGFAVMAVGPQVSTESETPANACELAYTECDRLYPGDHAGFVGCMLRAGCDGETATGL